MPTTGLGVMQPRLDTQRDQVRRAAKSQIQALRLPHTRPEEAVRLTAEQFDMDADTARQSFELFLPASERGWDGGARWGGEHGRCGAGGRGKDLPRLSFEQLVDAALAVEAQRELGLRQ